MSTPTTRDKLVLLNLPAPPSSASGPPLPLQKPTAPEDFYRRLVARTELRDLLSRLAKR